MNNCKVNIRVGLYHFMIDNDWKFSYSYNDYHKGFKHGYFEVYNFFVYTKRF